MNGLVNGNASSEDEGRTGTSGMYKVQRPYDLPTKVPLPNGVMYEMSPVSESVQGLVAERLVFKKVFFCTFFLKTYLCSPFIVPAAAASRRRRLELNGPRN